jgi:hypothetical protein
MPTPKTLLNQLVFHDAPLERLAIDSTDEILELTVAFYEDEKQDYRYQTSVFQGVSLLSIEGNMLALGAWEISRLDCCELEVDYGLELVVLQGFSKPPFVIQCYFKELILKEATR